MTENKTENHIVPDVEIEAAINTIHEIIKKTFPRSVSVKVFVNSRGLEVEPFYRTNISGYSMRTITGAWVKREER